METEQEKTWRFLKRVSFEDLEPLIEPEWDYVQSLEDSDNDSYYCLIIDALDRYGWTMEEYLTAINNRMNEAFKQSVGVIPVRFGMSYQTVLNLMPKSVK